MSVNEVTLWSAAICAVLAYLLPLVLWIKDRSAFRSLLLAIPALVIGSWALAEILDVPHLGAVGFTFYGAFPAAVTSNLFILALRRLRMLESTRLIWSVVIASGCVVTGFALHALLPAIAD
jgi:hypothetical protein